MIIHILFCVFGVVSMYAEFMCMYVCICDRKSTTVIVLTNPILGEEQHVTRLRSVDKDFIVFLWRLSDEWNGVRLIGIQHVRVSIYIWREEYPRLFAHELD